jgi:HEAT repeat protein
VNTPESSEHAEQRRLVVLAGHTGDLDTVRDGLEHVAAPVRDAALGALARMELLDEATLLRFARDPDPRVRNRVAELAAGFPGFDLLALLNDDDPMVVEMAAWSCGEHEKVSDPIMERLIAMTTTHNEPLVREAAVAALGAIGDDRGLPAILSACTDKPAIRRRAMLALAPFDGPDVDAALKRGLEDRDWQVRQAAEDLLG